jgi:hypothetical protein
MSVDYFSRIRMLASGMFDGRLENLGLHEYKTEDTNDTARMLTDGTNYVWIYINDDGEIIKLKTYGQNTASNIVDKLDNVLKTITESQEATLLSDRPSLPDHESIRLELRRTRPRMRPKNSNKTYKTRKSLPLFD